MSASGGHHLGRRQGGRRKSAALQMYHYFADKEELVQAVIDYQADAIVNRNRHALGSANGVEAWRKMVITAAKRTKAKGGCQLGSLVGQLAESDPEARALVAAGFDQWQPPSAMDSEPFMPTGNSRPTSTRTTSPPLCSPRSKEAFYSAQVHRSSRPVEIAVDTLLALTIGR